MAQIEFGTRTMLSETENPIRYKWDPKTSTGFQLRYDAQCAANGVDCCYLVEDWTCHSMINQWQCETLDEALDVLSSFFTMDLDAERARLTGWSSPELSPEMSEAHRIAA